MKVPCAGGESYAIL